MRLGLGGMAVLFVLSIIFKQDFFSLVGGFSGGGGGPAPTTEAHKDPARDSKEEPLVQFVSFVLDDNQKTWAQILPSVNAQYEKAKLVLFRDRVRSACGFAEAASGPFYCPGDRRVYIDLGFYDELREKFGASGEFAEAYVISHEIGHHIQNLLGIERKMRYAQQQRPDEANQLSVRMELQADCFAGIWGHSTAERNILENGDVEKGLNAAASIGDDRIQKMSGRQVHPESFTHGSSAQRVEWFKRGFDSGKISACNTFAGQ